MPEFNVYFLVTLVAVTLTGLVRGFSGFGSGLMLAPGLSLLYPPSVAVVMVVLLDAPAVVYLFPKTWRYADWRTMRWIALGSALSVPFGAYFLATNDPDVTRRLIGFSALVFVLLMAAGFRLRNRGGMGSGLTVGALAGYLGGATGVPGPPAIIYFLAGPYSPQEARGNITAFFTFIIIILVCSFVWHGLVTLEIIVRCLFLMPIYLGATWIGNRLFGRVSEVMFRRIAYLLVTLLSLSALLW